MRIAGRRTRASGRVPADPEAVSSRRQQQNGTPRRDGPAAPQHRESGVRCEHGEAGVSILWHTVTLRAATPSCARVSLASARSKSSPSAFPCTRCLRLSQRYTVTWHRCRWCRVVVWPRRKECVGVSKDVDLSACGSCRLGRSPSLPSPQQRNETASPLACSEFRHTDSHTHICTRTTAGPCVALER